MAYTVPDLQYFINNAVTLLSSFRAHLGQIATLDLLAEVETQVITPYGRAKRTSEMDNLVKLRAVLLNIVNSQADKKPWADSVMLGALIYCKYRIAKEQLHAQREPANSDLHNLIGNLLGKFDLYKIKVALDNFEEAMRSAEMPKEGKGFATEKEFATRRLPEIKNFIGILSGPATMAVQSIQFISTMTGEIQRINSEVDGLVKGYFAFLQTNKIKFDALTPAQLNEQFESFCVERKNISPAQKARMKILLSNKTLVEKILAELKVLKSAEGSPQSASDQTKFDRFQESFTVCAMKMARFSAFAAYLLVHDRLILPQVNGLASNLNQNALPLRPQVSARKLYTGKSLSEELNSYCVEFAKQFKGWLDSVSWRVVHSYRDSFHRYYLSEFLKYNGQNQAVKMPDSLDTVIRSTFDALKLTFEGVLLRGVTQVSDKYSPEQKAKALSDLKTWVLNPGDLVLPPEVNPWGTMLALSAELEVWIGAAERQAREASLQSPSATASMYP